MKIAFIGLGNMGGRMARNLLKGGFDLVVYDIDPAKSCELIAAGGCGADNIQQAVVQADVVMTSLPTPAVIRDIALDADGLIANMRAGAIWIELSTNNLDVWSEIRALTQARGINTLDSPVSGGVDGAANGSLTILVGGDEAAYTRCLPIFLAIGKRIEYLGAAGAGYVAKIAQVVLCYVNSIALSEALMLGVKGGVAADKMLTIIQNSAGRSYVADRYGPSILSGDFDPTFELGLALKDMHLSLGLAKQVSATLPICEQVAKIYARANAEFGAQSPHLAVVKLLEQANNAQLRA